MRNNDSVKSNSAIRDKECDGSKRNVRCNESIDADLNTALYPPTLKMLSTIATECGCFLSLPEAFMESVASVLLLLMLLLLPLRPTVMLLLLLLLLLDF